MKVVQVVTFVSADGAFGGPTTVALGQCESLAKAGHEVTLVAGWDGVANITYTENVDLDLRRVQTLSSALSFSGLWSLSMLRSQRRLISQADIVHVHLGRDMVTLPFALAAARSSTPTFVQTHGMVMPSTRKLSVLVDSLFVRPVFRRSSAIFALNDRERVGLLEIGASPDKLAELRNGIAVDVRPLPATTGTRPTVLFMARLHPRKRVRLFIEAMKLLRAVHQDLDVVIAGADEGDLDAVSDYVDGEDGGNARYLGGLSSEEARSLLRSADIFVLPSVNEPFPMTVLEAAALGTAVVITKSCGMSEELEELGAAAVATDGDPADVAAHVAELLDPVARTKQIDAAHNAVREHYSIDSVTANLSSHYLRALQPGLEA